MVEEKSVRWTILAGILPLTVLVLTVLHTPSYIVAKQDEIQAQSWTHDGSTSRKDNNRKIRILCLILTYPSNKNKMAAVNETWAKRCDKHLFIVGQPGLLQKAGSILYVPVPEGRNHLTGKVRYALEFAYQTYKNNFDWILKCDDDTYVIMENLRYLLSQADPKNPGYLGFHMKTKKTKRNGFMGGGAGYVISSRGLYQLIHSGFQNGDCRQDGGPEDFEMGLCLAKSEVPVLNSLDTDGLETFHPTSLQRHLYPPHPNWPRILSWNKHSPKFTFTRTGVPYQYLQTILSGWPSHVTFGCRTHPGNLSIQGSKCCSRYSISFHRVSPEEQFLIEHLLYKTEVHGLQGDNKNKHPVFDPHIVKPAY